MDPALRELLEGDESEELEVMLKLRDPGRVPPGVRVISRFGQVATCRMPRGDIREVWAHENVLCLKAPRLLEVGGELPLTDESIGTDIMDTDIRRDPSLSPTGRGVIVGVIDIGLDFVHPNFRNEDGSSRLLYLWDQGNRIPHNNEPYGYGAVYSRDEINQALESENPYDVLGYYPGAIDPLCMGTHGTHVCDIAAGNGRAAGSPVGMAPESDIIFTSVSVGRLGGLATLGDAVRMLEALDFISRMAGERPWVVNISMGRHGGQHDGLSLLEQAMDALLTEAPGRAIVQSCGNYFDSQTHAACMVSPGRPGEFTWITDPADLTENELEIWLSGKDSIEVEIISPDNEISVSAGLGEDREIIIEGKKAGHLYHRAADSTNGDNHIDIFLQPSAPAGEWKVVLRSVDTVDGRVQAWVERDPGPGCQSHFNPVEAKADCTIGTICNGFRTIVVGAHDSHDPSFKIAPFSSSGPTRDGRRKPDLLAPGVNVLAARSAPLDGAEHIQVVRKSGTSMATPHVTGSVALMMEAAGRPLHINETRRLLLESTAAIDMPEEEKKRAGNGCLDTQRAVEAAAGRMERTDEEANYCECMDEQDAVTDKDNREDYANNVLQEEQENRDTDDLEAVDHESEDDVLDEEHYIPEEAWSPGIDEPEETDKAAVSYEHDVAGITEGKGRFAGKIVIGIQPPYDVDLDPASHDNTFCRLDDALKYALFTKKDSDTAFLIRGDILGSFFEVFTFCFDIDSEPLLFEFWPSPKTTSKTAAIILNGKSYFPSDLSKAQGDRWVLVNRLKELYSLPKADRDAQIKIFRDKLRKVHLPNININDLPIPVLRLLVAKYAKKIFGVIPATIKGTRLWNENSPSVGGYLTEGITKMLCHMPLEEPECYLPFTSEMEGKMETINAWDRGAGISFGPIQFNVYGGYIFRFLWKLWTEDYVLFDQELGKPLGWKMRWIKDGKGERPALVIPGKGITPLQYDNHTEHDFWRAVAYFQSGHPNGGKFTPINPKFRKKLTQCFLRIVAWPHVQEMIIQVSSDLLTGALRIMEKREYNIKKLDPLDDKTREYWDTYIFKALMVTIYICAAGCMEFILKSLGNWPVKRKLKELKIATSYGHSQTLQKWKKWMCANNARCLKYCAKDKIAIKLKHRIRKQIKSHIQPVYKYLKMCTKAAKAARTSILQGLPGVCTNPGTRMKQDEPMSSDSAFRLPLLDEREPETYLHGAPYVKGSNTNGSYDIVETAEDILADADEALSPGRFLGRLIGAEDSEYLNTEGIESFSPSTVFHILSQGSSNPMLERMDTLFQVVGYPGEGLSESIQPGDIIVRYGLGEPGADHIAMITSDSLMSREELPHSGYEAESILPGGYAGVLEAGAFPRGTGESFARRVLDDNDRVLLDQMVLRLRSQNAHKPLLDQQGFEAPAAGSETVLPDAVSSGTEPDLAPEMGVLAREGTAEELEALDPADPDFQIEPGDEKIDVGAKFALKRMIGRVDRPDIQRDAARLILGLKGMTLDRKKGKALAGIYGDDLGKAVEIARKHNTQRWLLVPNGEDAALVLDNSAPYDLPPTVIFRGDTPDIRSNHIRIDTALQHASKTFGFFQRGELVPCFSTSHSTSVSNLVPSWICRMKGKDLLVIVTEREIALDHPAPPVPDARVQVEDANGVSLTEFTNKTGQARFPNLAQGTYRVTASKKGFEDISREVVHPGYKSTFYVSSSGAPGPVHLQLTKKMKWFLPATVRPVTHNNEIIAYVNKVEDVWDDMRKAIEKATDSERHFIFIAGWDLGLDTRMGPDANTTPTLRELLEAAGNVRNIQVRALLYKRQFDSAWNKAGVDFINGLKDGQAILDDRYLNAGSHHQKLLLVNTNDGLIGFCGSMDIQPQRRQWHEVHCRVTGPAAISLHTTFKERWNDYPDVLLGNNKRPLIALALNKPGATGTADVQVVRTYGNGSAHDGLGGAVRDNPFPGSIPVIVPRKYAFAPNGEQTIYDLLKNGIEQAETYIYIEDQYLTCCEDMNHGLAISKLLAGKLKAVADGRSSLQKIIIVINRTCNVNWEIRQTWQKRKKFIDTIRAQDDPANPRMIVVQYKKSYNIFFHAKTWIFDDELAVISSANCNRRGYSHDSELGVGIVDTVPPDPTGEQESVVQKIRMDLWQKHLSPPGGKLDRRTLYDPTLAFQLWEKLDPSGKLEIYKDDPSEVNQCPDGNLKANSWFWSFYKIFSMIPANQTLPMQWDLIIDPDGS